MEKVFIKHFKEMSPPSMIIFFHWPRDKIYKPVKCFPTRAVRGKRYKFIRNYNAS